MEALFSLVCLCFGLLKKRLDVFCILLFFLLVCLCLCFFVVFFLFLFSIVCFIIIIYYYFLYIPSGFSDVVSF